MEYTKSHLQHGDKSGKLYLHFHGFPQSPRNVTMTASNDFWVVGRYITYDTLFSYLS